MNLEQLRQARESLEVSAAERLAEEQAAREAAKAEAQKTGAENHRRYGEMVNSFQNFFRATQTQGEVSPAETPVIVLEKTEEGGIITAQISTLSYYEPEWTQGLGTYSVAKPQPEVLPDYPDAENFRVTYKIAGKGFKDERIEDFAAKRDTRGDGPPLYPWTAFDGSWGTYEANRVRGELDELLPRADETLTMLINAAADPSLNPELATQLSQSV